MIYELRYNEREIGTHTASQTLSSIFCRQRNLVIIGISTWFYPLVEIESEDAVALLLTNKKLVLIPEDKISPKDHFGTYTR